VADVIALFGSLSDKKYIQESKMMDVFERVGVSVDVHVISAHRNADDLQKFCAEHPEPQVYIAGAALATALPGAIAGASGMKSVVIGVPLDEHGIDSCLWMPPGVPVLTAGVGKAGLQNAAIAACQILSIGDSGVAGRLEKYLEETARKPQFNVSLDAD